MILIPVGDSMARVILDTTIYSPQFVTFVRFLVGGLIVLPFALQRVRFKSLTQDFYKKQLIRAFLIVLTVVTIIKAVGLSPIADVFGAFFIGPILSIVLSSFLLKEKATTLEWISVAIGFFGVVLVVQPAFLSELFNIDTTVAQSGYLNNAAAASAAGVGVYWAFLAGIFYGAFLTATRWAAACGPPLAQVTTQFLLAALMLSPLGILELVEVGVDAPALLIANGVTSVLANLLSIMALARARPATLAPVVYLQVVSATFIGLVIFQETLSFLAAIGIIVIVLSGCLRIDLQPLLPKKKN